MLVLTLVLVCGGGALVSSQQLQKQFYELDKAESYFQEFMQTYGRHYTSEYDKQKRFNIFKQNLVKINELNQGSELAVFGITKFADYKETELQRCRDLIKNTNVKRNYAVRTGADITSTDAPESFDWRAKNVVTEVKDQGRCEAGYVFSAIGNVEGQYAIQHHELVDLSAQQLLDCDRYSGGCCGGNLFLAFIALDRQRGIEASADYEYTSCDGACNFNPNNSRASVSGYIGYHPKDQDVLKELLFKTGPLSMVVNPVILYNYKGGIVDDHGKSGVPIHSVLLVGYGIENNTQYWIVKNSWGKDWGEKGYFRLLRGKNINVGRMMDWELMSAIVD